MTRLRLTGMLALLLLSVVVGACAPGPTVTPTPALDRLATYPEAQLYYPDAVLLEEGGHRPTIESAAVLWKWLATDASASEVIAFYQHELAAREWDTGAGSSAVPSNLESQVCAWHNTDLRFRLGFWKMDKWRAARPEAASYATVYEIALVDRESTANQVACSPPLAARSPSSN
jgi:hypothetical protein